MNGVPLSIIFHVLPRAFNIFFQNVITSEWTFLLWYTRMIWGKGSTQLADHFYGKVKQKCVKNWLFLKVQLFSKYSNFIGFSLLFFHSPTSVKLSFVFWKSQQVFALRISKKAEQVSWKAGKLFSVTKNWKIVM